MKQNQKGFGVIYALLIVIIIGLVAGIGYYVWHTQDQNKKKEAVVSEQQTNMTVATPDTKPADNTKYLIIKEWGVKIPLTATTEAATYRIENGYVYIDVAIKGDTNNECGGQAAIAKATSAEYAAMDEDTRSGEFGTSPIMIKGSYYSMSGSQAACSENETVQATASAVRTDLLNQAKLITAS